MKTKCFLLLLCVGVGFHPRTSSQGKSKITRQQGEKQPATIISYKNSDQPIPLRQPAPNPANVTSYGQLPLSFEVNQGQAPEEIRFLSRGHGYTLVLTSAEAIVQLPIDDSRLPIDKIDPPLTADYHRLLGQVSRFDFHHFANVPEGLNRHLAIGNRQSETFRMRLVGANPKVEVEGVDKLPGISNYFIGNDPRKWQTNIPNYSRVVVHDVYPGVSLAYYGKQGQVEFDFIVAPGADPKLIKLAYEGVDRIKIDPQGDLILNIAGKEFRQLKPRVFQLPFGLQTISGNYVLRQDGKVGFQISAYDAKRALVIDPELSYSTQIGDGFGGSIAVDLAGSAYVFGRTQAPDFPTTLGAPQSAYKGGNCGVLVRLPCFDTFISKLSPTGDSLAYSTYLGGLAEDVDGGITVDSQGNAYLTGSTNSSDFPTTPGAFQPSWRIGTCTLGIEPCSDAFVTKINPQGNALLYSTYLGGDYYDAGTGIAVDSSGNAYVTGLTESRDFPIMKPFQAALGGGLGGGRNAFVAKLNPEGSALLYSSYLGGSMVDQAGAVALDSNGNAYVTGYTLSADFPTVNPIQGLTGGVFVAKVSNATTSFIPASFFVPIVLSSSGLNNSFYTSELALTNRGPKGANIEFSYTAAFGGGSGEAYDTLPAGHQEIVPDAIEYIKNLGVPIPDSGDRGGTLRVTFSNLSTYTDVAVTVRTTTSEPEGRAGLAYSGVPIWNTLTGPSYLCGLRQNRTDRSNVAIQNAGTEAEGDIWLRLTVYADDPAVSIPKALPDERLSPGGFKQFSGILHSNGLSLSDGYVRVDRVAGKAPYYAYAVINDQANSDGSFIPPLYPIDKNLGVFRTLPVVLEADAFSSEVVMTNLSTSHATLDCSYTLVSSNQTVQFGVELNPGEQTTIPNFVQYLRDRGVAGIGPPGLNYIGPLTVKANNGLTNDIFVGARTSTPGDGGRYGVFYLGQPYFASANEAWIYGLQQNSENRSNVALVDPNESAPSIFDIDLLDGETGLKVKTVEGITVTSPGWLQINSILAQYAPQVTQGYARVIRRTGFQYFITYGVTNDGGQPGERTGDGAFIQSSP